MQRIIITDPANVTSKDSFQVTMNNHLTWLQKHSLFEPKTSFAISSFPAIQDATGVSTCVGPICVTQELADALTTANESTNYEVSSSVTEEEYFCFGEKAQNPSDYIYLGSHGSDSRMTAIVDPDIFNKTEAPEVFH
jgi:hypothetical protein